MKKQDAVKTFKDKKVRTLWDGEHEKWYFSIIDVIEILTNSDRPRKYWNDSKTSLQKEGSELTEKIGQLKIKSTDGLFYKSRWYYLFRLHFSKQNNCTPGNLCICAFLRETLKYFYFYTFIQAAYTVIK